MSDALDTVIKENLIIRKIRRYENKNNPLIIIFVRRY